MSVSRSSYYNWLNNRNVKKKYEQNRKDLIHLVTEIHNEYPSFGYRSINSVIKRRLGWIVSDNYVHKCCKYLSIRSKTNHYKWKKTGHESDIFPNTVKNNWDTTAPFRIIVSDTTSFGFKGKGYEWTYYLDVYNNEIVGSSIGKFRFGNNIEVHYNALEEMLENKIKRGYKDQETVLHTDQGSIYSSRTFRNVHKDYNIKRSMSRAGTPTDNPIIESLNGWYKSAIKKDIRQNDYDNVKSYMKRVVKYINNERPSSKLKYKTPVQYRIEQGFS